MLEARCQLFRLQAADGSPSAAPPSSGCPQKPAGLWTELFTLFLSVNASENPSVVTSLPMAKAWPQIRRDGHAVAGMDRMDILARLLPRPREGGTGKAVYAL